MRLRDHWAASAHLWTDAQPRQSWFLTFDGQLDFLASWLQPILERPYLARVPHEWLHVTLGPGDDVETVRARCALLEPLSALVGPARVVEGGVTAELHPADELHALFTAIGGSGEFWPHVAFAYACADADMDELEVNASDAVLIDAVSLVELHRGDRLYQWELLERVPLGGAA